MATGALAKTTVNSTVRGGSAAPAVHAPPVLAPQPQPRASGNRGSAGDSRDGDVHGDRTTVDLSAEDEAAADELLSQKHKLEASLGYKDELELRYIWDRVLGRGRHGTVTRLVIDRHTGEEFACKCMPKSPPVVDAAGKTVFQSDEEREVARMANLQAIKREITLFTELRSSLNVAKLQHIYEDETHVYLVMELCKGPTLEQAASTQGASEGEVTSFMKTIVRTIAQCHDKGLTHGAVSLDKFRFLGLDRGSPLKAVSFSTHATLAGSNIFETLSTVAPEALDRCPALLSEKADMWRAGLVAVKLLTAYFPFDDVLANLVNHTGILANLGPISGLLREMDDNPLLPSVAGLFVAGVIMMVDMNRSRWMPVSQQARDWVLRSLNWDSSERWSPLEALKHPWLAGLRGDAERQSSGQALGVVQRIQRFGSFSHLKQTALEHIAGQLLASNSVLGPLFSVDEPQQGESATKAEAAAAKAEAATTGAVAPEAVNGARDDQDLGRSPSGRRVVEGTEAYVTLVQHIGQIGGGVVSADSLAQALTSMGYTLTPDTLTHLLEQLNAVSTGSETQVPRDTLAASQVDWNTIQTHHAMEWEDMTRVAFDALDIDGDGIIQRREMAVVLSGKIPSQDMQAVLDQAMEDSGQSPGAQSLDYDAFKRLLQCESRCDCSDDAKTHSLLKFASQAHRPLPPSRASHTDLPALEKLNRSLQTHLCKTFSREVTECESRDASRALEAHMLSGNLDSQRLPELAAAAGGAGAPDKAAGSDVPAVLDSLLDGGGSTPPESLAVDSAASSHESTGMSVGDVFARLRHDDPPVFSPMTNGAAARGLKLAAIQESDGGAVAGGALGEGGGGGRGGPAAPLVASAFPDDEGGGDREIGEAFREAKWHERARSFASLRRFQRFGAELLRHHSPDVTAQPVLYPQLSPS